VHLLPAGRRNGFSEYLAIADAWYGRNVFLLTHAALATSPSLARIGIGRKVRRRAPDCQETHAGVQINRQKGGTTQGSRREDVGSTEAASPAAAELRAALKARGELLRRRAANPPGPGHVRSSVCAHRVDQGILRLTLARCVIAQANLPRSKRLVLGMSPAASLRLGMDHYVRQADHVLPVR
jgi:hypothetical protein